MTTAEIIKETEGAFSDPQNRAVIGNRAYFHAPNGKKCAVGRCLIDGYFRALVTAFYVNDQCQQFGDKFIQDKYKGHHPDFWRDLQIFHDDSFHFTETGISTEDELDKKGKVKKLSGRSYIQFLLKKWQ